MTWNTPKPGEWKSEELSQGRIIDYKAFNFVDGEGVRNSLYVAGCMFHCEGCYNVATWSFNAGIPYTPELEEQIMPKEVLMLAISDDGIHWEKQKKLSFSAPLGFEKDYLETLLYVFRKNWESG